MTAPDDLLTTAEALEILGLTDRSTLSRWVQIGRLKAERRVPGGRHGAFLFRRADVDSLAEQLAQDKAAAS